MHDKCRLCWRVPVVVGGGGKPNLVISDELINSIFWMLSESSGTSSNIDCPMFPFNVLKPRAAHLIASYTA